MNEAPTADYLNAFAELTGIVGHCVGHDAEGLRAHLNATRAIETSELHFGPHFEAAAVLKTATVNTLARMLEEAEERELALKERRLKWRARLDEFLAAGTIEDDEVTPDNGPAMLAALQRLEQGDVTEEMYGDLLEEAKAVRAKVIENYRSALRRISMMILDPDRIADDFGDHLPLHALESAVAAFKELPLVLETVGPEFIEKARDMHAACVKKQEAHLKRRKDAEKAKDIRSIEQAIEHREESEHRHRVDVASLSPEQRQRRTQRMIEAAEPMYDIIQRITEISVVDEENHTGTIDANGLIEVARRANAMHLRVEGKLN